VKYRREALVDDKIIDFLKQKIHEISETFKVNSPKHRMCIKTISTCIFKAKPTLNIPKILKQTLKQLLLREIKRNYPEVKQLLWKQAFWSPSYLLTTTGQTTLNVLIKYIESQGEYIKNNVNSKNKDISK
jgi:putative transposase